MPRSHKRDVECFHCHKKGHIKAECWAKGGGNEGGGPKSRKDKKNGAKDNAKDSAAAAADKSADIEAWPLIEVIEEEQDEDEMSADLSAAANDEARTQETELYDSGASRQQLVPGIVRALVADEDMATEVLPEPTRLRLTRYRESPSVVKAAEQFVATRGLSGRTVSLLD
jgi:hypothetical protein